MYDFIYRAMLTEEALDAVGRKQTRFSDLEEENNAKRLSIEELNPSMVKKARRMAVAYTAICAFENQIREFVQGVLSESYKEKWWEKGVSEKIRKTAEGRKIKEGRIRWLSPRGESMIGYIEFGDLSKIIRQNFVLFEPHIDTLEWAEQLLKTLEESRHILMHGGELSDQDIERNGVNIRDWIAQVGG